MDIEEDALLVIIAPQAPKVAPYRQQSCSGATELIEVGAGQAKNLSHIHYWPAVERRKARAHLHFC